MIVGRMRIHDRWGVINKFMTLLTCEIRLIVANDLVFGYVCRVNGTKRDIRLGGLWVVCFPVGGVHLTILGPSVDCPVSFTLFQCNFPSSDNVQQSPLVLAVSHPPALSRTHPTQPYP
jgi:hypothetical protein